MYPKKIKKNNFQGKLIKLVNKQVCCFLYLGKLKAEGGAST
jgi:hypothetical protein